MLQLSMTYDIVTAESAELGDCDERGFVFEASACTAHELARYIKREGFTVPSDSHGVPAWLHTNAEQDIRTGAWETRAIHPGRDAQSQRVWARVLRICGIVKGQP